MEVSWKRDEIINGNRTIGDMENIALKMVSTCFQPLNCHLFPSVYVSPASCSPSFFSVFPPSPQFCWSFVQTKAATPTHNPLQRTISSWDRSVMTSWRPWQWAATSWTMTSPGRKHLAQMRHWMGNSLTYTSCEQSAEVSLMQHTEAQSGLQDPAALPLFI